MKEPKMRDEAGKRWQIMAHLFSWGQSVYSWSCRLLPFPRLFSYFHFLGRATVLSVDSWASLPGSKSLLPNLFSVTPSLSLLNESSSSHLKDSNDSSHLMELPWRLKYLIQMFPTLGWSDIQFYSDAKAICVQSKPYFKFCILTFSWASNKW